MPPLTTYEEWKHCITVLCAIPLTKDYIAQRLAALRDTNDYTTQRFVETWGEDHLKQVINWFETAEGETV